MMNPSSLLGIWAAVMWKACWQGGLVVLAIWLICRVIPSMPARCRCWLWRLAILKFIIVLLLPTLVNLPLLPAHRAPEHMAEITTVVPTIQVYQEPLSHRSVLPMSTPKPTPLPTMPVVLFFVWI